MSIKRDRGRRLRNKVRLQRKSAITIQALWRRAFIRSIYTDPLRDYWVQCYDESQGPDPYYYNTYAMITSWKVPLAYKYFVGRYYVDKKKKVDKVVSEWIEIEDGGKIYLYNVNTKENKLKE
jgi:hypothetical protein